MPLSWTNPFCDACYTNLRLGREPIRLLKPQSEKCCMCYRPTTSGIYVRIDPYKVKFPRQKR